MMNKVIVSIVCLFFVTTSLGAMSDQLYMAIDKGQVAAVQTLLGKDATLANATLVRSEQLKAIHTAAMGGNVEIIKALLDKGADINAKDKMGMTPLHYAVQENHADAVTLLLARGANKDIASKLNETPLSIAKSTNNSAIVALLTGGTTATNTATAKPTTVVNTATGATQDKPSTGSTTNTTISSNPRPTPSDILQGAIAAGNITEIKNLLAQDRTLVNKEIKGMRRFPLLLAVASNQLEIVTLLLANGADKSLMDTTGKTALALAQEKGFKDIINLLSPTTGAPATGVQAPAQASGQTQTVVVTSGHKPQMPTQSFPTLKKQITDSLENVKKIVGDVQTYNAKQKNHAALTQALSALEQVKNSLLDLQAYPPGK